MAQDNQSPELFGPTPFQTVGPFFHYALPWKGCADLVGDSALGARPELMPPEHDILHVAPPRTMPEGEPICVAGRIVDGAGTPVPDALVEIWQADASGVFSAPPEARTAFVGFGRCATDEAGGFRFLTIRPGAVRTEQAVYAPHLAISVLARGILRRLVTRAYFDDDPANDADPVLALVPEARRPTLMARLQDGAWQFDIHLQGEGETVFFQC